MPLATLAEVIDRSFDYIVIGGGPAGLVVAARLTEDPTKSVLVLEAGEANIDDPEILRPGQLGSHFGKPNYDWFMKTVPQKHMNNLEAIWPRGKGLGGSTGINFLVWTQPSKGEIDDWEKLGNKGWNWDDLSKYSAKTVSYTPLARNPEEVIRRGADEMKGWEKQFGDGPIKISHPLIRLNVDIQAQQTLLNMGIPKAPLPLGGNPRGTIVSPNIIDPSKGTRSYATTGFYIPNAARPNFVVLTSAYVNRIITSTEGGELVATGVEFTYGTEESVHTVSAKKEVVLSAGALKSPQILELSGIGRPDILQKIGVPVKLALEGVGENVQEHSWVALSFQLKDGIPDETFDLLRFPGEAERHLKLMTESQGLFAMGAVNLTYLPLSDISEKASTIYAAAKADVEKNIQAGNYSAGLAEQYKVQLDRLERQEPSCEIIGYPGFLSFPNPPAPEKKYYTFAVTINNAFSRGTIHAASNDPKAQPDLDPQYFEKDIDLQIFVELVKYARKISQTAPLKDFFDSQPIEANPGANLQSDEEIIGWLKGGATASLYHTAGSLSMLPKEKGGVVDTELKVYGTKNLRVVDLSVVPLHFSSHTQSVVYAIAEKAAAIIANSA